MNHALEALILRVSNHLKNLYPQVDHFDLCHQIISLMKLSQVDSTPVAHLNLWDQSDVVLISYGDSIKNDTDKPLKALNQFISEHLEPCITSVHLLPFFPWSSDDGFSVIDYYQVNESLGDWQDIEEISKKFKVMADLVINHGSSCSRWFENFKKDISPGKDYFQTANKDDDLSAVVRPRTNPLLREVAVKEDTKYVWCTFSEDQIDFNFQNPEVLLEFIKIIRFYLDRGIKIFRLDAVAFLWKEIGGPCINLDQTHEIIRLLRCLIEHALPEAIIITETNIPNRQNLTYFGNANEAHCIYNFSLPPLLINTLITGSCLHLKSWLMSMPPAQSGTCYFNFIASHDGVGLRPTEGLLKEEEITRLVKTMESFGGKTSWRALPNGEHKAYEMNISLIDALKGNIEGPDEFQFDRFICAHCIMLGLEGIPAFYIHSLLATENDYQRVTHTHHNRHINRHQWRYDKLMHELDNEESMHYKILKKLKEIIAIRQEQAAFHPNAIQFTLHLGEHIFAFWRQSMQRDQSIFCIHNIHWQAQVINLADINLISTDHWVDLITGNDIEDQQQQMVLAPYQTLWIANNYCWVT